MTNQGFFNFAIFNSLMLFVLLAAIVLWRKPSLWLYLFTLFLGFVVGWFDVKATEVSPIVLILLTFGFFAGFAQPKRAWLSALFLGIWIPAFAFAASNLRLTNPTQTELITSFLALVFSFVGAHAGAIVRRFAPRESISSVIE
jgi:hypothetical protein